VRGLPPVTRTLLTACAVGYLLQLLTAEGLVYRYALWPPWQLVSYAFLHGDLTHLLFNMLGLWTFGAEIERVWGPRRMVQFLVVSALSGGAAQMVVTALAGSLGPTVGASGALYGLLLAYALMFPTRTIMPLIPPIPMKARTYVMVFGGLEFVLGFTRGGSGGVAHFAHLGGMLGAWLLMRYWRGRAPFKRPGR